MQADYEIGALVDGYDAGLALRDALPAAMADQRAAAMFELLRSGLKWRVGPHSPGQMMYGQRAGEHWRTRPLDYVGTKQSGMGTSSRATLDTAKTLLIITVGSGARLAGVRRGRQYRRRPDC